jgi:hypothetical protein
MLVAGPNMVLLQQHQGYAAPQIKKQEQNTIQSLRGNLATKRGAAASQQHLDQENQCFRTGKCGNADLGQQTLGSDNSVTGFTNQSKNIQNRVVVTPTPTASPILGTPFKLTITKHCNGSGGGTICPPRLTFSINVTGNNPQPSSFTIGIEKSQVVTLEPGGTYTITETPVPFFNPPIFFGGCKQTGPYTATVTFVFNTCDIINSKRGP